MIFFYSTLVILNSRGFKNGNGCFITFLDIPIHLSKDYSHIYCEGFPEEKKYI